MSKKTDIWMPLYIGDYLADTGHLTTTQHGAYLLLLMHYWRKRGLPADDKQLAAIAKLPLRIWLDTKETIQAFFHEGWKHSRIESELARRAEVSNKRAEAGAKGGAKSRVEQEPSNCSDFASSLLKQNGSMTQSQSPSDRIGEARASKFTEGSKALADAFLKALGFDTPLKVPPEYAGTDWRAVTWEAAGWTVDLIDAEARRIGPDKPLTYYEKVFATSFAKRQAPLPVVEIREAEKLTVTSHGKPKNAIIQAADDLRRKLASFDGPARGVEQLRGGAGEASPRMLSNG